MKKRTVKQIVGIATYCILLVALLLKLDWVLSACKTILSLLTPLFIGFCIAFLLNRPFLFFRKLFSKAFKTKDSSKGSIATSLILTYLLFFGLIALFFSLIIPEILKSIGNIITNYEDYWESLQGILKGIEEHFHLETPLIDIISKNVGPFLTSISGAENVESAIVDSIVKFFPHLFDATVSAATSVFYSIFGVFISIYLLASRDALIRQFKGLFYAFFKKKTANRICYIVDVSAETFGGFISGRLIDATIIGFLCFFGLTIFKFQYPLLISVIVGVTNVIPVIGPFLGAIPSALLLLISPEGGLKTALLFAIFILVLQQLDGNIIGPKVVGNSTGLPAVWTMLTVIIGGGSFGILGAFLGVPLVAVIYKILKKDALIRLEAKKIVLSEIINPDGSSVIDNPRNTEGYTSENTKEEDADEKEVTVEK